MQNNGQQSPGMSQAGGPPGGFSPDQNPFEEILAGAAAQPTSVAPDGPPGPPPTEMLLGKTGDNTKPLLSAVHNLHNYISGSTKDSAEIRVVRNIISALTQLVQADQQRSLDGDNEPPVEEPAAAPAAPAASGPAVTAGPPPAAAGPAPAAV